jgi:hypothetical protein
MARTRRDEAAALEAEALEMEAAEVEAESEIPAHEYVEREEKLVHRGAGQVKVTLGKRFERVQAGGLDFMQEVWDELSTEEIIPVEAPPAPAEVEVAVQPPEPVTLEPVQPVLPVPVREDDLG